jgi:hypothetical protein
MNRLTPHFERMLERYPGAPGLLGELITGERYFDIYQRLSDNYSPTLTVSRVQGPLIRQLVAEGVGDAARLTVDTNARRSGSITVRAGHGTPKIWLSAHADICSYLTGPWDGSGYPLTPFCMHRVTPGRRAAMALTEPTGEGPLGRLIAGEMVTLEDGGSVRFECDDAGLPLCTRVVHHLAASWNRDDDRVTGFLDNQAGSAAVLLATMVLSRLGADVLGLINDEEEGPVDRGNQGFSRAANRLLHRTPSDELPDYVVVSDGHDQEAAVKRGATGGFGLGASFVGFSSQARGAVVPPQLLVFARDLAALAAPHGVALREGTGYVGRSDDISAMQFTPNISIIGYPNAFSHFDQTPRAQMSDLVALTRVLVVIALLAQDADWRAAYL